MKKYLFILVISLLSQSAHLSAATAITVRAGGAIPLSGNFMDTATISPAQFNSLFGSDLGGFFGGAEFDEQTYGNVYTTFARIALEFSFGSVDGIEWIGGIGYGSGGANERTVGALPFDGGSFAIRGVFDDYSELSLYLGARYFFSHDRYGWRPYVGLTAGYKHVSAIGAQFSVPALEIESAKMDFYDATGLIFGGVDSGVYVNLSDYWIFGAHLGIHLQGKLKANNRALEAFGLESLNDGDGVLMFPFTLTLSRQF